MRKILVLRSATREMESSVLCPIPTTIFPCPACCFKWHASRRRKASGVLGSPYGVLLAHGQARYGLIPYPIRCRPVRMTSYMQRENGRLHLHGETCHHFALFPYLHPGNKVKSGNVTPMEFNAIGSIMEISVIPVFLALFYNHTLVAQECSHLHCLVVSQFYTLPSVALFQPFEQVVIAVDITTFKSSV